MYEYSATVIRVVDGDTIHANVDLGCDIHLGMTIRLARINALRAAYRATLRWATS